MELIIGLLVIGVVGYFVLFRKKDDVVTEVPYKVETPPTTVTALGEAPATVVVAEGAGAVTIVEEVKVEVAPAVVESPVVAEAPAKKTRKPRAPKAATPAKPVAKKAAPVVKKAAAIKAKPKATRSKKV